MIICCDIQYVRHYYIESLNLFGFFRPLKKPLFEDFLGLKKFRAFLEFSGP
jgi:hypothetical protein